VQKCTQLKLGHKGSDRSAEFKGRPIQCVAAVGAQGEPRIAQIAIANKKAVIAERILVAPWLAQVTFCQAIFTNCASEMALFPTPDRKETHWGERKLKRDE
jgi:hypothetical protein